MKRALTITAALFLVALGTTSSASARGMITTGCPWSATLIAGVSYGVTGEPVQGASGNVWATADYTRTVAIYRVGKGSYCAARRDTGSFTTLAGASPGGRGTVAAGISGRLTRTAVTTTFTATWQPSKPTSGYLGSYPAPADWTSFYFGDVQGLDLVWWANAYLTSTNGCWANLTGYPSIGDILSAS
jgi:hypothetical protein